jgi:choline kinase
MRAIVLCAGRGGRLRPLTDERPKCLFEVGGQSILERCLAALRGAGLGDVLIVTGYRSGAVEAEARRSGWPAPLFVANPDYESTNTAVSLRLALAASPGLDCVQVNGDVVFDGGLLGDLLRHPVANAVVVDDSGRLAAEEVKVAARDGLVARIGKHLEPADCLGEAIGLNKISASAGASLVRIFDRLAAEAGAGRQAFGLVMTGGRPWVEIDTPEDYEHARHCIAPLLRD